MIDINDFILARGGNPDKIKESQRRRGDPVEVVDQVIELWEDARKTQYGVTQLGSEINAIQKQIGLKKRAKEDASELLQQKEDLEKTKKAQEVVAAEKNEAVKALAKTVGNYVADNVPVSDNEDNNEVLRTWGPEGFVAEALGPKGAHSHHQVLEALAGYDPVRGIKIAGHRGFCLTGHGLFLNLALVNYGIAFLYEKGYTPNQPPYFMNRDQMAKTAQLSQFDEELYRVSEGSEREDNLKYLIATSEQPLSVMHADEWLHDNQLPIKYCGYSTNFRKEAGSGGRDTWGIFRVHQFEKIEQFVLCAPDESWNHFESMLATSEEFYKSLGIPYRLVSIVSGALNNAAARKVDLEGFFPFEGDYRELVSCSNCTDYQTRELGIHHLAGKGKTDTATTTKKADAKKTVDTTKFVHALNATLCATQRTLCAVLENYQTPEGLNVPEVLRKYIPGEPKFIPYVKPLEKEKESTKKEIPIRPAK